MASPARSDRWLVTGAAGFLGANLGIQLDGQVHRIGVTRGAPTVPTNFDEWLRLDLRDVGALASTVENVAPDVIVHAAALSSHEQCEADPALAERINVTASKILAQVAERLGARFVFISTDAVFDGARGRYQEDDPVNPLSVYGRTKAQAEREVLHAAQALIIRTNFFGWSPSGRRSILEFFVNELSAGHRVRGFTDFITSSAYVQVLAEVMPLLAERQAHGVFHVTSPQALTKYEFGVAVAQEFDLDPDLITPTEADIYPARRGDISLDVSKVQADLGHRLATQFEGIARARRERNAMTRAFAGGDGP